MDTFVVRVWQQAGEDDEASLRGVVERVSTGERDRFLSVEELVSLLRRSRTAQKGPRDVPDTGSSSIDR